MQKVRSNDINNVVITGGGLGVTSVVSMLKDMFKKSDVRYCGQNTALSRGAAVFANNTLSEYTSDILSLNYDLGIRTKDMTAGKVRHAEFIDRN